MATLAERLTDNAPGKFYVDASCLDCDQCRVIAPDLFSRNDDSGLSFVSRQPQTPDEISKMEEAIGACASSSIGDDGA